MRYGCASAVGWRRPIPCRQAHVRARFTTTVLVALGALAVGALSIAASLAVSDPDKWPGWLRPYHSWGWPAVWVLLAAFVVLAVWQYTHPPGSPHPAPTPPCMASTAARSPPGM